VFGEDDVTWTAKRRSAHDGGASARARPGNGGRRADVGAVAVEEATPPDRDIVVVGASAGGVEALVGLAASLPADLPAAVFVVLHLPATGTSALPDILSRHGPLAATPAKDGEPIENGRIYVAPPDHHLLLRTGHVHLTRGPRENGHRPAVDTLQSEALEAALWIAMRTLEERAALANRLAEPARRRGHSITATRFEEEATEAKQAARLVRNLLLDRGSLATAWSPATEHHPADSPSSTETTGG
jgi:hypothetical protein